MAYRLTLGDFSSEQLAPVQLAITEVKGHAAAQHAEEHRQQNDLNTQLVESWDGEEFQHDENTFKPQVARKKLAICLGGNFKVWLV